MCNKISPLIINIYSYKTNIHSSDIYVFNLDKYNNYTPSIVDKKYAINEYMKQYMNYNKFNIEEYDDNREDIIPFLED